MGSRMSRSLVITGCLLVLSALSAFARVDATPQSAVGKWKLDVSRSSYQNMPAPKFEQLVIITDEPKAIKWNMNGAGSDGKSYMFSYDGPVDGKDHALMSGTGAGSVAYTRPAAGGLQWTMKDKAGAVTENASAHISPNGRTLTVKGTTQGPNGKGAFTSVFLRVE